MSSDPNTAAAQLGLTDPNADKYKFGLTLNDPTFTQPRMAGQALGLPSNLPLIDYQSSNYTPVPY